MLSNRSSYLLLVVGCLGAAAGGGYLAVRQAVPASATSISQAPGPQAARAASTPAAPVVPDRASSAATPTAAEVGAASAPNRDAPALRDRELRSRDARAQTDPAPARARKPSPASTRPTRAADTAPPPQYGPVAGRQPLAGAPWQSIEQSLPNGNPAPPDAVSAADQDDNEPPIEQFIISSDSVIGLEVETPVSSETARVEDPVEARISRDVKIGDHVAIPAGTLVRGTVAEVERGGKLKTRARLGLRFTTIVMPDGANVPISTDVVFREGASPGDAATRKVGAAAVAGTILGAIFGGAKGALIGGATGAAGGTAVAEAGDRHPAAFPAGATITVRLRAPATVTVEP